MPHATNAQRPSATPNKITRHTASAGCALGHSHKHTVALTRLTRLPAQVHICIYGRRRVGVANCPSPLVLLLLLLATAAAAAALSTTPPSAATPCVRARARPQFITPRQRGEPQ
jgi:hypothetical protein